MAKSHERLRARKLRIQGWSIRQIAKKLLVAKGSVSLWCRDIRLNDKQIEILKARDREAAKKGRLIAAQNKINERLARMRHFMEVGRTKVGYLTPRDLFIAGLALYWAEGSKKYRRVILINSDPWIIKIWVSWLQKFAGYKISELQAWVGVNEIHKYRIVEIQKYWSRITNIPLKQFRKPSFKKVKNKKIYENFKDHFGSVSIIARKSTNLCYEILGQIEALGFEASHGKIIRTAG